MGTASSPATIDTALAWGRARLQGGDHPSLEAQLLLAHALGLARGELMVRGEQAIAPGPMAAFERAVQRRAAGEPLAYITGHREFWSLPLRVTPAVLVPRPETELVVERALALLGMGPARVADLGTGSGAIALALARERPHWHVTATDRSAAALALATANARALAIDNVRFLGGDWYGALAGERFELIASNPPYVGAGDPVLQGPALRHEPLTALASGISGLEDLAAVIAGAGAHLSGGGWLVLEHGAGQAPEVEKLLVAQGFRHVRCHADLAGLARVTEAQGPAA
jgi:release factor glutamine methyltransferase